jgi:hypothetical protein
MKIDVELWANCLSDLLKEKRSRANDQKIVNTVYMPVDSNHSSFLPVLFSAYESNLDSSILQGFWNALGRTNPENYYLDLAKRIAKIYHANPDRAVELLHFPGEQPNNINQTNYFKIFLSSLEDLEISHKLHDHIAQLQLTNEQPWKEFCQIVKKFAKENNGRHP